MNGSQTPATRTAESLGRVVYQTRPNTSNLLAGCVIGVLLIGGGLTLAGYCGQMLLLGGADRPQTLGERVSVAALVLVGVALICCGFFLLRRMVGLLRFRLSVCTEGFYYEQGDSVVVFAWSEIREVHEEICSERLPLAKGEIGQLLPETTHRFYRVVRCDGEEFAFDDNQLPRTSLLAGPLASAAKTFGFAWRTETTHV